MVSVMNKLISKTYQPYQMAKTAQFGIYENIKSRVGIIRQEFKPQMKLHFAFVNQTLSQKAENNGTEFQDSRIIAVNHNASLSKKLTCKIDDHVYKILDISPGHDTYISYDLVTLSEIENRKGGQNGLG